MSAWKETISNVGLRALGLGSPVISGGWFKDNPTTTSPDAFTITIDSGAWLAPSAGILCAASDAGCLVLPNGVIPQPATPIFRIAPHTHLRLARLLAEAIEQQHVDPPVRPVPCYFVYDGGSPQQVRDCVAGDDLEFNSGTLSIHDAAGIPIPLQVVASEFLALMKRWSALEARPLGQVPTKPEDLPLTKLVPTTANQDIYLHCVDLHGFPAVNAATLASGLTTVDNTIGLFRASPGASLVAASSQVRLGKGTQGKLAASLTVPALAPELKVDGLRIVVQDVEDFLIGTTAATPEPTSSPRPVVRHDESVDWCWNGQAVMGEANRILTASGASRQIVVAPEIRGDFVVPASGSAADSQWPNFPIPAVFSDSDLNLTALRDKLTIEAAFQADSSQAVTKDVILTVRGLPLHVAVRVYHRVFSEDAVETRGDGASGLVVEDPNDQTKTVAVLWLKDPLQLDSAPDQSTSYLLIFDLRVTTREASPRTRLYGALEVSVGTAGVPALPASGTNPFQNASFVRSSAPNDQLGTKANSAGESLAIQRGIPRMVRRESIVVAQDQSSKKWSGLLTGTRLVPEALNSLHSLGSPGGHAGPEYDCVGLTSHGGPLTYDLARAALRRAVPYKDRLGVLESSDWAPTAQPGTNGQVSAAVLQTVGALSKVLTDTTAVQAWVDVQINQTLINNGQDPFASKPNKQEVRQEHDLEYRIYQNGRHDAFWALNSRIQNARRMIYIDGLGFGHTGYSTGIMQDLWALLDQRMTNVPTLNLILCLTKHADYTKAYSSWQEAEEGLRWSAIDELQRHHPDRVLAYHPMAFAGRPLSLLTNLIVIDDVWAMLGTSSFRRRGLGFDGGCDVVYTGYDIQDSVSSLAADLRRKRLATHLGLQPPGGGEISLTNWVRIQSMEGSYHAIRDLLNAGGGSGIEPLARPKSSFIGLMTSISDPED